MDFTYSAEQQMLLDSLRRFVGEQYSFEQRQRIMHSQDLSREMWRMLADLGVLALNIPEREGGLGAGPVENLIVATVLGEGLVLEPFASSAVIATRAIVQTASESQRTRWLPQLADGSLIAVLAHEQPTSFDAVEEPITRAMRGPDGWMLNGYRSVVYHAPVADLLLIPAAIAGAKSREIGLFAVNPAQAGVHLRKYRTIDGQSAADIALDNVKVPAGMRLGADVAAHLDALLDLGAAVACAESVGALDRLMRLTVEYCTSRVQFGAPIARFQVLQHRMADMLIHVEQARSMACWAAFCCELNDRAERAAAISAARVTVSQAARFVGQQAIQLHGGMGMADELSVSHYFKRLLASDARFGSTEFHLERYARSM